MESSLIQAATQAIGNGNLTPMPTYSTTLTRLLPEQKRILELKYSARPFGNLSDVEQQAHSLALLVKINVVTGWPTPESKEERNILSEQLKLYLIENWSLFNVEEIMYAMRSYATSMNNWGKNINLSLIGTALVAYENERSDISKLEESKKPQTNNLIEMKGDWKGFCETYYQDYLSGKFNFTLMPYCLYDEFVRSDMMAADSYEDWINEAKRRVLISLKSFKESSLSENEKHEYEQKIIRVESGEDEFKVIEMAKKLAVQFLYSVAKKMNKKSLFVKE